MTDLKFAIAEEPDEPAGFSRAGRAASAGAISAASLAAHRGEPLAGPADGCELRAPARFLA